MAPGKACNPVSPGFRRGLFVDQEAPGGNPGTPGTKTSPPSMPHDFMPCSGSNLQRMAHAKACNPESPGSRRGLFVDQEAPGGNPGTPGMKTTPPSMPHDFMPCSGSNLQPMAPGKACNPVSPGFRRGLFVAQEAPGGNPGTPGVKTTPQSTPWVRVHHHPRLSPATPCPARQVSGRTKRPPDIGLRRLPIRGRPRCVAFGGRGGPVDGPPPRLARPDGRDRGHPPAAARDLREVRFACPRTWHARSPVAGGSPLVDGLRA